MYKMRWVTGSAKLYCFSTSTFCFCLDRAWASNQIHSTRFDRPDVLVCVHPFSVPSTVACVTVSVRPDRLLMSSRPQGRVASCGCAVSVRSRWFCSRVGDPKLFQLLPQNVRRNLRQNILQNLRQNNLQNLRQKITKSPTKYSTKSGSKSCTKSQTKSFTKNPTKNLTTSSTKYFTKSTIKCFTKNLKQA